MQEFRDIKADAQRPVVAHQRESDVARAITDGEIVLASVDLSAPPSRVVDAMMTSECERWWGAPGVYTIEGWKATLVPGGSWSLIVRLPDGTGLPSSGEFVVVEPQRIVQTRRYDFPHPTLGNRETRVTTLLQPIDHGTRVIVRHEDFGSAQAAVEHAGGWERMLEWLRAYFESEHGSAR